MTAIEANLIEKLKRLPPSRVAEALNKIDALHLPPISYDEIEEEVQAARRERRTRQGA